MKRIVTLMTILMLLSVLKGCNKHRIVIDPSRAHQLVPGQTVQIYVPTAEGPMQVSDVVVEQRWFFKRVDSQ